VFLIFDDSKIEFGINCKRFHRYTNKEKFEYIDVRWDSFAAGFDKRKV
jgi:hypothetical protein